MSETTADSSYHRSDLSIAAEDSQLTLFAPYVQAFLTKTTRRTTCCHLMLPLAFERAAKNSFINPKFDSHILEEQYQNSIFPQLRSRFRFALLYIACMTLIWFFYLEYQFRQFSRHPTSSINLIIGLIIATSLLTLWTTFTRVYRVYMKTLSGFYAIFLSAAFLGWIFFSDTRISSLAKFSICIICVICMYAVIPLQLHQCVLLAVTFSLAFESLSYYTNGKSHYQVMTGFHDIKLPKIIAIRVMLQICIHLISFHLVLMSSVRKRGTFIKVGQNLLVRRQLELEKQLKEQMIASIMPKIVADMLLKETQNDYEMSVNRRHSSELNVKSMFRPFHMHSMKNVSILFADIVGFTNMSSNKTAEQLVEILNDLFERFDRLCGIHGCEKISTLGDCYYCVSGCPNSRDDHAICCVDMGLGMIEAMRVFDSERHEGIKMRVGIHTGNVMCGIVGVKRVKFDVWSNDVTFANKMESTGTPDMVHISEETKAFLGDVQYEMLAGEEVDGHKTFFIKSRRAQQRNLNLELQAKQAKHLSANDIPSITPASPHVIAHSKSLSPSPILNTRRRLASIGETVTKLLSSTSRMTPDPNRSLLDKRQQPNPRIIVIEIPEHAATPTTTCQHDTSNQNESSNNEQIRDHLSSDRNNGNSAPLSSSSLSSPSHEHDTNISDVRSYISQSRCDVSPFNRSSDGSRRFRSAINHQRSMSEHGNSISPWTQLHATAEHKETSASRRDSGFPTSSRKSSAQRNGLLENRNRLSGYFTSRESGLSPEEETMLMKHLPSPIGGAVQCQAMASSKETLKACVQHLRKQSDLQLIKCVRDNAKSQRSYLVKPPINKLSLKFEESDVMEKLFRHKAHRYESDEDTNHTTLTTPKINTFIDVLMCSLVFVMISVSLFLLAPTIHSREYKIWVCSFVVFCSILFGILFLCSKQVCRRRKKTLNHHSVESIFGWASSYYPWNFFGSLLISLPVLSILINYATVDIRKFPVLQYYYGLLLFVALTHFWNFIQINCWIKNILALLSGIAFVVIGCNHREVTKVMELSRSGIRNTTKTFELPNQWFKNYEVEICLDLFLILVLIFLLNRESEISYRVSFYGNEVAHQDKIRVQNMKNQADLLLHNIIPKHVAEELKNTAKYSKNHQEIGILFASIVNFNELYDESYLGGREYLRVLNELIADFDELLLRDEFKCVEKIKTIGSTYMCASGLDSTYRNDSFEHLYALLDFAVAMQNAIESFNRDLLEFNLVLRIGFNYGDVTAGVIGTTKLYYDIWGDAVNVASRMDSTGVPGRIQLRKECVEIFNDLYEFEERGKVYVKGKDMMDVCLFKSKKEETLEVFIEHHPNVI